MRVMLKFRFPVEAGNEFIRSGKVPKVLAALMEQLKPEAAYFFPEGGERAGLLVFDMQQSSQVAQVVEALSFGLHAHVELVPVMSGEDLQQGLAGMETILATYG
jgi:hypothetical protein